MARPYQPDYAAAGEPGRLRARPLPSVAPGPSGLHSLGLGGRRDALLYVPDGQPGDLLLPLVVMLHGAGAHADDSLHRMQPAAQARGVALLAPSSRGTTWDLLRRGYAEDVVLLDHALTQVFAQYPIDPAHLALAGFSDGASYALSLGLTNGDLFTHLLAFAPGFMRPAALIGQPRIYIAHGTQDHVLPIDGCSRRLVPVLLAEGYVVEYHEFAGPHTVPPAIALEALDWFLAPPAN